MTIEIIAYDVKPTELIPQATPPWMTTYGHYQRSHYHPATREVMVVLSGPGKIRWSTADFGDDLQAHTYGSASDDGTLSVDVNAGDLFVIPAGVTHKSFDPIAPNPDPQCLTGGGAHKIEAKDPRTFVGELNLSGFSENGATHWYWNSRVESL
ncbi:hypothetical protein BDW75DRAFT_244560 [Aspergillus navahoensis]